MSRAAFSLAEVMVTVFVFGLLTMVAVTGYQSYWFFSNLRSQQQTISSDLEYARQLAITSGVKVDVNFTHSGYFLMQSGNQLTQKTLGQHFTLDSGSVGFAPSGFASRAASVQLFYKQKAVAVVKVRVGSGIVAWVNL